MREGFTLAIVGRPNAGKSSLFNALLERDRAIVTATPGTTRDAVTEQLSFEGIPVELTDTAGLREALDEAELLGIARTRALLAEAAIAILVVDLTQGLHAEDLAVLWRERASTQGDARLHVESRRLLVVANKTDLFRTEPDQASAVARLGVAAEYPVIAVSAQTGDGVPALRAAIHQALAQELPDQDTPVITSLRQHAALTAAVAGLAAATRCRAPIGSAGNGFVGSARRAVRPRCTHPARPTADDILKQIFSTFCIGK